MNVAVSIHTEAHKKRVLVLRHLLVGLRYHEALSALEFSARHTTGLRKDGVTPNFDHPVKIALHALTLSDVTHREEVIATVMTHDLQEDYDIPSAEIRAVFSDATFAGVVADATARLTKTFRGERLDDVALFEEMSKDPVASIVKPCDRISNQFDMAGTFSDEKITSYVAETEELILPMVKKAKRAFPRQTMAYENLAWTLKSQVAFARGMLAAAI